jgi:raffinose/stachyose/melibiose transport system permease protein
VGVLHTEHDQGVDQARSAPAVRPADARRSDDSVVGRRHRNVAALGAYPYWFYLPAAIIFGVIFVLPTLLSFYYSLTRWTLFETEFIGLDNFFQFTREPSLTNGLRNTFVYAIVTSGLKVVLGLLLAVLLTSSIRARNVLRAVVFFPVLVSTVAVGITFAVLMHPSRGLINTTLAALGIDGPAWLIDPDIALWSVALVDVWKGVGIALVIFIAGILSIPEEYSDAAKLEGGAWVRFRHIIVPLSRNATFAVILLSFISGLRTFDLIWTMTRGGPGFSTDVLTSTIYKQYQAGFYGLATAGNVILFIAVTALVYPLQRFLSRREIEL